MESEIEIEITSKNMIALMVEQESNWILFGSFITKIIKKKDDARRK